MPLDTLYVSPHLDDAVFSAGGSIALDARAGRAAAVVTVFSSGRGAEDRRAEDRAALRRLGAKRFDLELPEAPERHPGALRPGRLFASLPAEDLPLVDSIAASLHELVERHGGPGRVTLVGPLGVGLHLDHRLVHRACARAGATRYYEDLPYGLAPHQTARRLAQLGLALPAERGAPLLEALRAGAYWASRPAVRALAPPLLAPVSAWMIARAHQKGQALEETRLALGEERRDVAAVLDDKLAALSAYASQWPQFYPTLGEWRMALASHARRLGSPVVVERFFGTLGA